MAMLAAAAVSIGVPGSPTALGTKGKADPSPAPEPAAARQLQLGPVTADSGDVPPSNPSANMAPSPNFLADCSGSTYDNSTGCTNAALQAIDNARSQEGIGPMELPSTWYSLTPQQQMFVAVNLERTARGEPALSAMASALDSSSQQAAARGVDPSPPSGFPWTQWGGNWAGAVGNPLEAMYYWMYDDGEGSNNVDCTPSNTSGCWGHRDNVLMVMSCRPCLGGAGYSAGGYEGYPSWTALMVDSDGSVSIDATYAQLMGEASDPADPAPSSDPLSGRLAPGAVAQSGGAPSVFAQGSGSSLLNFWYIPQNGTWGSGTVAGGGSDYSGAAVLPQSDGEPSVLVEGPGGSLMNYWYIASSGTWGAATVAGAGSTDSVPAVLEQTNGAPTVFVDGSGGSLMNYWYIPSQGSWGAATVG